MLIELHEAGAEDQVRLLADRIAADAPDDELDNAFSLQALLHGLWRARAREQVGLLAGRAAAEGRGGPPGRDAHPRLPGAGLFGLFRKQPGNEWLYQFGRQADGGPAPAWGWDDVWQ